MISKIFTARKIVWAILSSLILPILVSIIGIFFVPFMVLANIGLLCLAYGINLIFYRFAQKDKSRLAFVLASTIIMLIWFFAYFFFDHVFVAAIIANGTFILGILVSYVAIANQKIVRESSN